MPLDGRIIRLFTPLVAVIGYVVVAVVLIFPIKLPRREKPQSAVSWTHSPCRGETLLRPRLVQPAQQRARSDKGDLRRQDRVRRPL